MPTRSSRLPTYHRYAGKALPSQSEGACHLLAWHSLDVAAVGWHLLAPERPLTRQLAAQLGIEPEPLRRLLVFLLCLHDLGKFSRAFQEVLKLALDGMALPQGESHGCYISQCLFKGVESHVGQ
ncbi:CRISPR-associated endonuclease Cas3'' [Halomonas sp. PAMB 3232]|uniref:CRISPR-associated endonuclease Cas3'' n=1 Tax=Halomonas sp. PAMB 3232 TaxID=3075221 RepID=UPI0028A0516D|nr:CRISPR-associated endonuclease Cas3'' [Halomonas sp. PAMB 3232]WNL38606.1 CRISPR-associated endonuclease Cas3'' [Halomonas sp. PAMB 3232]